MVTTVSQGGSAEETLHAGATEADQQLQHSADCVIPTRVGDDEDESVSLFPLQPFPRVYLNYNRFCGLSVS